MSEYKERFEKLEREMAQLKKDVNREEEFVPVMKLEDWDGTLRFVFKDKGGKTLKIGALTDRARLMLLSTPEWADNFDLFQSQNGTYSNMGVEFKRQCYYITDGVFHSCDFSVGGEINIYNLKTATPYVNCHDPHIRRTKQTLTPIIF